jgi:hypothetical protein
VIVTGSEDELAAVAILAVCQVGTRLADVICAALNNTNTSCEQTWDQPNCVKVQQMQSCNASRMNGRLFS